MITKTVQPIANRLIRNPLRKRLANRRLVISMSLNRTLYHGFGELVQDDIKRYIIGHLVIFEIHRIPKITQITFNQHMLIGQLAVCTNLQE